MKLLKYIPLQLVFFQIIGILIGFYIPFSPRSIAITLIASFFALVVLVVVKEKHLRNNRYFRVCTFLIFIGIGIASITFSNSKIKKNHYSQLISKEESKAVLRIDKQLKPNAYSNKYIATLISIRSKPTFGKVLLSIQKENSTQQLQIDSKIVVSALFKQIQAPKNPYQFNYKAYLLKQQVTHQITVNTDHFIQLKANNTTINGWAYSIRNRINKALKKAQFKGDELAIVNALVLGQRNEVSREMLQNYQNAGAIHILAVSGLHIGIILLLLNFFFSPLEKLKHGTFLKLLLIVSLLWLYAFIAGMSASIIRAVTMFTAVAISLTVKKRISIYRALIISAFFLLLYNPNYLFDVGFQLSYVAVFFIVFAQPIIYKLWKPKFKAIDYLWQLFTVSIAAQIGVLPLSLLYFHQFPSLFFVSNLLIIPFLGFILGLGILVISLALLGILPDFIARFYESVIMLMNAVITWIGNQEKFVFQDVYFSGVSVVIYFVIVILFFRWIAVKKQGYLRLALLSIILFQFHIIIEKWYRNTTNEFIIFHKMGNTIIGIRKGEQLEINHTLKGTNIEKEYLLRSYITGTNSKLTSQNNQISSVYQLDSKKILVVDSLGVYAIQDFKPDYILLINSPKLNVNRLLKKLSPELVIADGSNYKNQIRLWRKSCKNHDIKFINTSKDGAFVEKLYTR